MKELASQHLDSLINLVIENSAVTVEDNIANLDLGAFYATYMEKTNQTTGIEASDK